MVHVRKFDPPFVRKPFSVRVVVPCYKEDIETLEETVECAIKAAKIAMDKGQANAGEHNLVAQLTPNPTGSPCPSLLPSPQVLPPCLPLLSSLSFAKTGVRHCMSMCRHYLRH